MECLSCYDKNPWLKAKFSQLGPLYKNLFSLKFETGSFFLNLSILLGINTVNDRLSGATQIYTWLKKTLKNRCR